MGTDQQSVRFSVFYISCVEIKLVVPLRTVLLVLLRYIFTDQYPWKSMSIYTRKTVWNISMNQIFCPKQQIRLWCAIVFPVLIVHRKQRIRSLHLADVGSADNMFLRFGFFFKILLKLWPYLWYVFAQALICHRIRDTQRTGRVDISHALVINVFCRFFRESRWLRFAIVEKAFCCEHRRKLFSKKAVSE